MAINGKIAGSHTQYTINSTVMTMITSATATIFRMQHMSFNSAHTKRRAVTLGHTRIATCLQLTFWMVECSQSRADLKCGCCVT